MEITENKKVRRLEQSKQDKIKEEKQKYFRRNTPLFSALINVTKTKNLIKEGWNVNHVGDNGITPLFYAIKIDAKKEIIEMLIESGAKPNQDLIIYMMKKGIRENFELFLNIYNPHEESYKLLLATAINLFLRRREKIYFFLKLFEYKKNFANIDISELLNHSEIKKGQSPLAFEFLDDEEINILTYLFDHGANVNAPNVNDSTLLDYAVLALSSREEVVYLLLERGGKFSNEEKLLAVEMIEGAGSEEDALRI
ncbi:MAG: hypothetical protein IJ008_03865 [Clostridia bacterium]|nr:hypothetical protein [Clostridia bacterium]